MAKDFTITSPAFKHNGLIPGKYTSDGENISPPLAISGVPENAAALALIVDDPDAATDPDGPGHTFVHWILFNISPQVTTIEEGATPTGATNAKNGMGQAGYTGPAPPNGEHRYFFKLHALSNELDLDESATPEEVEAAILPITLAKAELVGRYARLDRA